MCELVQPILLVFNLHTMCQSLRVIDISPELNFLIGVCVIISQVDILSSNHIME